MVDNIPNERRTLDEVSARYMQQAMSATGLAVGGLVDFTAAHGDVRPERTIQRTIQRMRNGTSNVSGEMRVLLSVLARCPEIPR